MAISYPFGLSSVLMTKTRTQGASFMQYQPRSGASYTKFTSTDNPVFFNVTFRFRQVDAQRFIGWFKGALQEGRLPFTVPMRTEFGLAIQEVRFYAAQGDTILDHSQEGSVHTYTGTVFASSLAYPEGIEDNWDFVASPFWQYRGEWDLALNSMTPVAKFIELNFASRFYAKNEFIVNLDEVLSFSRASVGTDFVGGVLTDFAVDEVRVGDGGLLVEKQSTNEIINSRDLTESSWSKQRCQTTPDTATITSDGYVSVTQSINKAISADSSLLFGVQFEKISPAIDQIYLQLKGGLTIGAMVNINSGAITAGTNPPPMSFFKRVGDSAIFSIKVTGLQVSNVKNCQVFMSSSTLGSAIGQALLSGAIGLSQKITNMQVEISNSLTSIIATNSSRETRQQDNATIDISDISEKAGSYIVEFKNDGIAYGRCIASACIDSQNSINVYISQSGQIVMVTTKSGLSQSVFVSGTPVVGDCRVGVSYSDSSATISVNGVSQSISGDWSNEMQVVALGMDDHGETHLNSHISYFKFSSESATESELNQWTGA